MPRASSLLHLKYGYHPKTIELRNGGVAQRVLPRRSTDCFIFTRDQSSSRAPHKSGFRKRPKIG